MIARIRLKQGRPIRRIEGKNRHIALAFGALLIPASLMAYALGFWRLASDMGMAGEFGITGLFSHWQVWIATGVLLNAVSYSLNRYGRGGDLEMPRLLRVFPARPGTPKDAGLPPRKAG